MPVTTPRKPSGHDYLAFYVGIPLLYGLIASSFAVPPQGSVDLAVIVYVCFRALAFWVIIDLACRCVGHSLARYRLPLWAIFSSGFVLAGAVIYLFVFVAQQTSRVKNPSIAASIGHENMGWNIDYLVTVASYAIPALVLWFLSAFGYQRALNVELFSYAPATVKRKNGTEKSRSAGPQAPLPDDSMPAFLSQSRLSDATQIRALKAEEHYIRIWTEKGSDLLRYRFKDAVNELRNADGLQVHRSWWVHLSSIDQVKTSGRKLELQLIHDELIVPVSLSYKQNLMSALELRDAPLDFQTDGNVVS